LADTRSLQLTSPGNYSLTNKKGGKTVASGTLVFAPDNKTRTLTTTLTDASGKTLKSVAVYDRQ
jgi:hypothetical protein